MTFLNRSPGNPGYAVFAEVVDGMVTADAIVMEQTGPGDVLVNVVTIERAERVAAP